MRYVLLTLTRSYPVRNGSQGYGPQHLVRQGLRAIASKRIGLGRHRRWQGWVVRLEGGTNWRSWGMSLFGVCVKSSNVVNPDLRTSLTVILAGWQTQIPFLVRVIISRFWLRLCSHVPTMPTAKAQKYKWCWEQTPATKHQEGSSNLHRCPMWYVPQRSLGS